MQISLTEISNILRAEKATRIPLHYNYKMEDVNHAISNRVIDINSPPLVRTIQELELEHLKHLLKEYILTRLKKLRYDFDVDLNMLSNKERLFYKRYADIFQSNNLTIENNFKSAEYVAFVAMKQIHNATLDGEIIDIYEGDFL